MLGYGAIAPSYSPSPELPERLGQLGLSTAVVGKNHFGWDRKLQKPRDHGFEDLQIYDGLGNGFRNGSEFDDYDRWFQQEEPGENPLRSGGLDWNSWRGAAYEFDHGLKWDTKQSQEEWLHPTAWTGRRACQALDMLSAKKEPFFLKVSFHRPHSPYDPPDRWLNTTVAPSEPPALAADGWDLHFRNCTAQGSADAWCGKVDNSSLQLTRRAYLANVRFVDEQIGEIVHKLRNLSLFEKTFILFTSDHGDMQMDHYLWRKGYPYEGSAHIPLLFRWPQSATLTHEAKRIEISEITELRDVFPTFLDVLGAWSAEDESHFDGRPLTWLLSNSSESRSWRQWVDLEHDVCYSPENHWNALCDGQVKYIFNAHSGQEQIFNLTEDFDTRFDPQERRDLSALPAMQEPLRLWRQRLVEQFLREHRGTDWAARWPDGDGGWKACCDGMDKQIKVISDCFCRYFLVCPSWESCSIM
ncbi:Arylsulfatase (Cys-type sulfatase) [Durusdinium trenchii]|uniref:Arylsulfatase (Cys-type sulfatase) n=1 Tax=Durusdinium trenchii TaxID=1381693 RepID=A0ABP0RG22_9DINO